MLDQLNNLENYYIYTELVQHQIQIVDVTQIDIKNWDEHITAIINILKDGIETDYVQNMFITIIFADGISVDLSIFDYFFNLIMWNCIIQAGGAINSEHLFFPENITKKEIKQYIDDNFIDVYRRAFFYDEESFESSQPEVINRALNNMIEGSLYPFSFIDLFSFYLANTINIEDTIDLMNTNPRFNELMNLDLSDVSIENVKAEGMNATNEVIDIIVNSDHCLADSFKAHEGVNPKQFKEFAVSIGSKPDGRGGIFPAIINRSFLNGGVSDVISLFIESSGGKTAQIIAKMNVGTSGHFARLLGLNNRDTILYPNSSYVCDSVNMIKFEVKDSKLLRWVNNRYYRLNPRGLEYKVNYKKDKDLIGKTIYIRSPMTCASHARGEGICYRCYGDLAYTNCNINIGQLASELLSSALTQRLLSAKHLLEAVVLALKWVPAFNNFFEVDYNIISLIEDFDYKGYKLIINPDDICVESEEDNFDFNEYITKFYIKSPENEVVEIYTEDFDSLYISSSLNEAIRTYGEAVEDNIELDMEKLVGISLFMIYINNNELSKTLELIKSILNKKSITESFDIHSILQKFVETVIEGGLNTINVHLELLLSNQLRSVYNILEKPDWSRQNEDYRLITLNDALTNNPSITVSMFYQKLAKVFYNPLSFKKDKPSFLDLLFMERPQEFIQNKNLIDTEYKPRNDKDASDFIIWDDKNIKNKQKEGE